jgi:hypothetical protein
VPRGAAFRPLALIGIALAALITYADPDLWGHTRFGLDMLSSGRIHAGPDPYSFTADRPWINHEWLSELIMGVAYRLGGASGLVLLKAAVAIVTYRLVWDAVSSAPPAWRWAWMAFASWGTLPLFWSVRPQIWSGLALAILCRLLIDTQNARLWIIPIRFAAWANLHGGWIVGGGVLALWTSVEWIRRAERRWTLTVVGIASLGATLINPYGLGLWRFLFETVGFGRENIQEWQPIWTAGAIPIVLWLATATAIVASARRAGWPSPPVVVVLTMLALASIKVIRLGPLFVIATVLLLGSRHVGDRRNEPAGSKGRAILDGMAVAIVLIVGMFVQTGQRCITTAYSNSPDAAAAESLRGRTGRLATYFDWGEYALWHFGPALQVSIDGRRETVYSDEVTREQTAIGAGHAEGLRAIERLSPDYVWLPSTSTATAEWLKGHGYREDVRTKRSFIATRSDLPPVAAWPGQPSGCFPGP